MVNGDNDTKNYAVITRTAGSTREKDNLTSGVVVEPGGERNSFAGTAYLMRNQY